MNASFKLLTVSLVLGAAVWACGSDDEGTVTGTPGGSSGSGGSAAGEPGMTDGGKVGTAGSATAGTTMTQGGASDGGASTMPMGGDATTAMGGDSSTAMGGDASVPIGGMAGDGGAGGEPAAVPSCKGVVPVCSTLSAGQCLTVGGCAIANKCTGNAAACSTHLSTQTCAQADGCDNGQTCTGTPTPCADRATAIACDDGCTWTPCGGTATPCAGLDQNACGLQSGCSWQ